MALPGKRDINYYLVVGAAAYWSTTLLTLASGDAPAAMGATHLGVGAEAGILGLPTPGVALLLIVGTVFSGLFSFERARGAVAWCIAGCAAAVMLLACSGVSGSESAAPAGSIALVLLRAVESSGLILLWGLAFSSLDKETAGQTVALTALCSVFGYFCLLGVARLVPQVFVVQTLYIGSAAIILLGKIRFANRKRRKTPEARKRAAFFASRAAWGMAIGFVSVIPAAPVAASVVLLFVGMSVVFGMLLAYLFSKENLYAALPVFPLAITGLVFMPFLLDGLKGIEGSSVAMMWVAWILLSSFQLSELKEAFGMSEAGICFSEKAVLMASWAVGLLAGNALYPAAAPGFVGQDAGGIVALVATYTVILCSSYSMFSLVYTRREGQLLDELSRTMEQRMAGLYDEVAADYGLSAREREVMEMLAQGYTRTYIKERLVISDGTAKAHIAHVYQKLGIHKKDELLRLMNEKEKAFDPSG